MWILDSLSEVQIKKPFLVLWITLGAAFLLLATFFSRNALYHPATFSVLAASVWLIWQKERTLLNALMIPALSVASFLLVPDYVWIFSAILALVAGKIIFPENFRIWKWIASAALMMLAFPIVDSWQAIPVLRTALPAPFAHLIYAAVLAFCVQFALLPFQLRRDSVIEAFGHYSWKTSGHAHHLASETVALYAKIKTIIRVKEHNPKIQQDLEDYTERVLHQCYRLQEISVELSNVSAGSIEQQIVFLTEKLKSVEDFATKMQYEQALLNKEKQLEQYENLKMQQERLLSQIINYNSSLENVRLAYANQDWQNTSSSSENIDMFMDLVKARAEAL